MNDRQCEICLLLQRIGIRFQKRNEDTGKWEDGYWVFKSGVDMYRIQSQSLPSVIFEETN